MFITLFEMLGNVGLNIALSITLFIINIKQIFNSPLNLRRVLILILTIELVVNDIIYITNSIYRDHDHTVSNILMMVLLCLIVYLEKKR